MFYNYLWVTFWSLLSNKWLWNRYQHHTKRLYTICNVTLVLKAIPTTNIDRTNWKMKFHKELYMDRFSFININQNIFPTKQMFLKISLKLTSDWLTWSCGFKLKSQYSSDRGIYHVLQINTFQGISSTYTTVININQNEYKIKIKASWECV